MYHTHHRESLFLLCSVFPMLLKAIQMSTTVFISLHREASEQVLEGGGCSFKFCRLSLFICYCCCNGLVLLAFLIPCTPVSCVQI